LVSLLSRRPSPRLIAAALTIFVVLGLFLTRRSVSIPATNWMGIYDPSDFPTAASLAAFVLDLRIPVPAPFAVAEALTYQLAGSTALVTVVGYRAAMVGGFALALYLAARSNWRVALSFAACTLFVWGTVKVHPSNPQVYDVYFPAFVLLWIAFEGWAVSTHTSDSSALILATFSGVFLAMAELTRPFFVVLLPFTLAGSAVHLAGRRRALALSLVLPVLLISGGWHVHMWLDHGQLFWSNHGGFNLAHAWRQVVAPPPLLPEPNDAPIAPGRLKNLNTDAHTENSERLTAAVTRYAASHPAVALTLGLTRVSVYLSGPVPAEAMAIPAAGLSLYRWSMAVGLVYLVVEMAAGGVVVLWHGPGAARLWAHPGGLLVLTAFGSMVLQALGSAVEEARMVLALLPMVAALPGLGVADYLSARGSDPQRIGSWLVALALLVLVASFVWDPLRGVPFELSDRQLAGAAVAAGLLVKGLLLRRRGGPSQ
jgi:hypothetical protein